MKPPEVNPEKPKERVVKCSSTFNDEKRVEGILKNRREIEDL